MAKAGVHRTGHRVLSRTEVSAMFGVSVSTITRWAREGRLPCLVTLGGHRRYLRDDVLRLVRGARAGAGQESPRV